jgi:hypothetical protein
MTYLETKGRELARDLRSSARICAYILTNRGNLAQAHYGLRDHFDCKVDIVMRGLLA